MNAALFLCILPLSPGPIRVDQIEVNHVYSDDGSLWLKQVIFWRWEPRIGWAAEGWRRTDQGTLRATPDGGWRWEEPGRRDIQARQLRRTWTQYDREAANRPEWPIGRRLSPP